MYDNHVCKKAGKSVPSTMISVESTPGGFDSLSAPHGQSGLEKCFLFFDFIGKYTES